MLAVLYQYVSTYSQKVGMTNSNCNVLVDLLYSLPFLSLNVPLYFYINFYTLHEKQGVTNKKKAN